jgi:dTDP-4-dehydrorhamnose reductase
MKQRVLLTGITGLFGKSLVKNCSSIFEIFGVARNSKNTLNSFDLDITNFRELENLVTTLKPKVIIHAAAIASHEKCQNNPKISNLVNVKSTEILAKMSKKIDAKLVFMSSDSIYSSQSTFHTEGDLPNPFTLYGEQKLKAENKIRKHTDNFVILRGSFFTDEPSRSDSVYNYFKDNLLKNSEVYGFTDIISNSLDTRTLSELIVSIIHGNFHGTFNYGTIDFYSKYIFGKKIGDFFGSDSSLILPVPSKKMKNPYIFPRNLVVDTSKIRSKLKVNLPNLSQSIQHLESSVI